MCVCALCCRQTDPRCTCCFRCAAFLPDSFFRESGQQPSLSLTPHPRGSDTKRARAESQANFYSSHGRTVSKKITDAIPARCRGQTRPRLPLNSTERGGSSQENKSRAARDRRSSARSTQHARSGGNPALPYVSCRNADRQGLCVMFPFSVRGFRHVLAVQKKKHREGLNSLSAGSGQGLLSYCCSSANGEATYRGKQKDGSSSRQQHWHSDGETPRQRKKKNRGQ